MSLSRCTFTQKCGFLPIGNYPNECKSVWNVFMHNDQWLSCFFTGRSQLTTVTATILPLEFCTNMNTITSKRKMKIVCSYKNASRRSTIAHTMRLNVTMEVQRTTVNIETIENFSFFRFGTKIYIQKHELQLLLLERKLVSSFVVSRQPLRHKHTNCETKWNKKKHTNEIKYENHEHKNCNIFCCCFVFGLFQLWRTLYRFD